MVDLADMLCQRDAFHPIKVGVKNYQIKLLTPRQMQLTEIACKGHLSSHGTSKETAQAAALVAACTFTLKQKPAFKTIEEVLCKWGEKDIETIANAYECLHAQGGFLKSNLQQVKQALKSAPWERIKWQVIKELCIPPNSATAQQMTQGEYLYCYANILLDKEEQDGFFESGLNESWGKEDA